MGLGLINVKYKAMAELTRSFMETAKNSNFLTNLHHQALYLMNVEERRDIPNPMKIPYMSEEVWNSIRQVKAEGLLNLSKLTSGQWYRVFLENNVTMETDDHGHSELKVNNMPPGTPSTLVMYRLF